MKITYPSKLKSKHLIVFDLDGTLAPTKSVMDGEMVKLFIKLLKAKKVAVIGGGKYGLFKEQMLGRLKGNKSLLQNLFLFPTTANAFYRYNKGWIRVYSHELSKQQIKKIIVTFHRVLKEINYQHPKKTYGEVIENRGTQVTFSALGQDVVKILGKKGVVLKQRWTKKNTPLKMQIAKLVGKYLPELEVHAAGFTSIDVTKKGIDKAYGLRQIEKQLRVKIKDMVFIGDAIFPGGNDYAITKTPVDYMKVLGPEETKKIIRNLI